ncbi:MAG: LysR family transcriptional regulator [Gammaproteobacteria bacterium]
MQQEQIETFLDLLESGSFSRTAERLQVSQSTVSGRIRLLEEHLGTALFTRGRHGAEATAVARRFEHHANVMRNVWLAARRECQSFGRYNAGLRIAGQVSLLETLLGAWVGNLRRLHPQTMIYFEADYSQQMTADLAMGGLDMAVLYQPRYLADIYYETLFEEHFVLVSSRRLSLAEVVPETYIRVHYSHAFDRQHLDLLPQINDAPMATGLGSIALNFLLQEGGAAYLPTHTAAPLIAAKRLYAVRRAPRISHIVYSAMPHMRRHLPLIKDALSLLRRQIKQDIKQPKTVV